MLLKGKCFCTNTIVALAQVEDPICCCQFPSSQHVHKSQMQLTAPKELKELDDKRTRLGGSWLKKEKVVAHRFAHKLGTPSQAVVDGRSHHHQQQPEPVSPWLGPAARADNSAQLFVLLLPKQASKAALKRLISGQLVCGVKNVGACEGGLNYPGSRRHLNSRKVFHCRIQTHFYIVYINKTILTFRKLFSE